MKAAAGGGAGTVHLLASLTSIATCLLVVVCLGSVYRPNLRSLLGVRGGSLQSLIQLPSAAGSSNSSGWAGGLSVEEGCLAAASNGAWRRVLNLT